MTRGIDGVLARIDEIRTYLQPVQSTAQAAPTSQFSDVLSQALTTPGAGAGSSRQQIEGLIRQAAARYGVSEALIREVVRAESDFNPRSVSHAGAKGLMQLMPENCEEYGVSDPFDPAQNIDGGVRHLKDMIDQFGRLDLALAAYNAGPGAVRRYGGIPPYAETRSYVQKIRERLGQ